jgi:hypothetical protein
VAVSGGAAKSPADSGTEFFAHREDGGRGSGGLFADFDHAAEEVAEPAFPVAGVADGLQAVLVFGATALQVVGEVKNWLGEEFSFCKEEGNEEPGEPELHGIDRMDDFGDVGGRIGVVDPSLGGEQGLQGIVELDGWVRRKRRWEKGPVARGLADVAPSAVLHAIVCVYHGLLLAP